MTETRILLVSHELSPTGAVRSLLEIYQGFIRKGYIVELVSLDEGYISPIIHLEYPNIKIVSAKDIYNDLLSYKIIVANTIVSDSWILTQSKAYGQPFFDRLIWYIRELPVGRLPKQLYSISSNNSRERLLKLARTVIFVSHASRGYYLGELGEPYRHNFKVLYNPVGSNFLENPLCANARKKSAKNSVIRNQLRIPKDDVVISIIGKFSEAKGSFDLLSHFDHWVPKQWESEKTVHLVFVGEIESDWFSKVKQMVQKYHYGNYSIRIHAIGPVYSVEALQSFYAVGDIFALNSHCEAFGRVVLEAFTAGTPVLAKNCGGPSEFVRNMTLGFLYNTGLERISLFKYIISNHKFAHEVSKKSCKYVRRFHNPKEHIKSLETLII